MLQQIRALFDTGDEQYTYLARPYTNKQQYTYLGSIQYINIEIIIRDLYSLFLITHDEIIYNIMMQCINLRIKVKRINLPDPIVMFVWINLYRIDNPSLRQQCIDYYQCDLLYNFPSNNYIPLWVKLGIKAPLIYPYSFRRL